MSKSYLISKTIDLPASGTPVPADVSGSFFRCYRATAGSFEMSFDGQQWFEFEKGLRFRLLADDSYVKLWFRSLAGVANSVSYFYGTAEVDDNRLNIIDNQFQATLYVRTPTLIPNFSEDVQANWPDGTFVDFPADPTRESFEIDVAGGDNTRALDVLIQSGLDWKRIGRCVRGNPPRRFYFSDAFRLWNNSGTGGMQPSILFYNYPPEA